MRKLFRRDILILVSLKILIKKFFHIQADKRKFIFGYQLLDGPEEKILAEGETHHIVTDSEGKPRILPDELLNYYKPFIL